MTFKEHQEKAKSLIGKKVRFPIQNEHYEDVVKSVSVIKSVGMVLVQMTELKVSVNYLICKVLEEEKKEESKPEPQKLLEEKKGEAK